MKNSQRPDGPTEQAPDTTTKSAHTPGPWEFTSGPHDDPDFEDCDFLIAEQRARGEVVATALTVATGSSEANARLIAAAPELLAALKAAAQFIEPEIDRGPVVNGWQNTIDMVHAAIAKAEGKP